MITIDHECLSKGLMDCWRRTYLFMWMVGGHLDLPRTCAGKHPEGGAQRAPGWIYRTPLEISNLHQRRRVHGLVPSPTLNYGCMD